VEVTAKNAGLDSEGKDVLANARDLNLDGLQSIRTGWIFFLDDILEEAHVRKLAAKLLSDPIEHQYVILKKLGEANLVPEAKWEVEVHYKRGVTDTIAESLLRGAEDLGIGEIKDVRTGRIYWLCGTIGAEDVQRLASGLLANGIIQEFCIRQLGNKNELESENT